MVRSLNLNCSIAIRHTIFVSLCFLLFQTVDCEICDSTKKKCFLFSHFLYKLLHCIVTLCMVLFCYCFVSFNFSWKCSHWMLTAPLWIGAHITETNNALEHIPRGRHKSLLEIRAGRTEWKQKQIFSRNVCTGTELDIHNRRKSWIASDLWKNISNARHIAQKENTCSGEMSWNKTLDMHVRLCLLLKDPILWC